MSGLARPYRNNSGVTSIFVAASHLEPIFEPVIEQAGFKLVRLRIMGGASKTPKSYDPYAVI